MKSILVLTDFSEKGLNALTYGRMLFEKMHITFHLHNIYKNGANRQFGERSYSLDEGSMIDAKKLSKILNGDHKNPKHQFSSLAKSYPLPNGIEKP